MHGLCDFAKILMEVSPEDASFWQETQTPALLLAAKEGHVEILRLLYRYRDNHVDFAVTSPKDKNSETILHCLLKKGESDRFMECMDLILNDENLAEDLSKIINQRDNLGNTPLHLATERWSQKMVGRVLEAGANIGMKNRWNEVAIDRIDPETLEDFINNFCMTYNTMEVHTEDFEITFKYSFLAPVFEPRQRDEEDTEAQCLNGITVTCPTNDSHLGKPVPSKPLPETQSIWYLSQSNKHQHLLKHPVIASFLDLKWNHVRSYFNKNLGFYLIFSLVLTWYIFDEFGSTKGRAKDFFAVLFLFATWAFIFFDLLMDVRYISKDQILRKKSIGCDLSHYWKFLLRSLCFESIFLASTLVIMYYREAILWHSLLVLLGLLLFRELMQALASFKRYIFSTENWAEMIMCVVLSVILFCPEDSCSRETKRYLSAFVIVISWAELITLIAKHPRLTSYNVYITMFYQVLKTFMKFFVLYAAFIIAYGLGFHVMIHSQQQQSPTYSTNSTEMSEAADEESGGGEREFFYNPWLAQVKSFAMFAGELDANTFSVNDKRTSTSVLGNLFFLSFIVISIVLMNLVIGLAISDIIAIRNEAEIVSYKSRVAIISYVEAVLLGDPYDFLSLWPKSFCCLSKDLLASIPNCSLCKCMFRCVKAKKFFNWLTGATGILLFYKDYLPGRELVFQPNSTSTCQLLKVHAFPVKCPSHRKFCTQRCQITGRDDRQEHRELRQEPHPGEERDPEERETKPMGIIFQLNLFRLNFASLIRTCSI